MFKRILLVASVIGLLSVALAGSAAAGPGGYGGSGLSRFSDASANANFGDPYSGSFVSVYVDRVQLSFKTKRMPGAPVVETTGTALNINEYSATGVGAYGCWIIPDSACIVAGDLSGATLKAQAAAETPCPGYYVGGAIGGKPGLQSSLGYGGGPGSELPPTTAVISWMGNGAIWSNGNSGTSHCQSYAASFHSTFDYEFGTATGSVGDLTGQTDPPAQVGQSSQSSNANSIPSGACNPFGFSPPTAALTPAVGQCRPLLTT